MLYALFGFAVGALGTLIGVGGGFLIVPVLIFLHPEMPAVEITAISLFCVAINAVSGSTQYLIKNQVHLKAGLFFAFVGLPGVALGIELTRSVARENFAWAYASLLAAVALYLLIRSFLDQNSFSARETKPDLTWRQYTFGGVVSAATGILAGFFGIGGGVIHVPFLNRFLNFPMRYATATSQFILAITSIAAVIVHLRHGSLQIGESFVLWLAIGLVFGAQLGAWASRRINATTVVRILALVLLLVAGKIFYTSFFQ